jgi:hypothetical protein
VEEKTIRIACQAAATLPFETLVAFQGTLKTLPPENAAKLRREIIEMGFSAPFHVWKCVSEKMSGTSVTNYVLDGHQRLVVLEGMAADGYTIPPLPVAFIEAADEAEAKRKLLAIASSYGHMTPRSLAEYLEEAGIEFDDAVQRYDLPDVDFETMRDMLDDEGHWAGDDAGEGDAGLTYTNKVEAPVYRPTGEKPPVGKLFDLTKYRTLCTVIDAAEHLGEDEKAFLKFAASRHIVFSYQDIAEYYAHAPKETQALFEQSALVIIDFGKAIENGFVRLTKAITEAYSET